MQDAENLYPVSFQTVDGERWQPGEDKFGSTGFATRSSLLWELRQHSDAFLDRKRDAVGSNTTAMFLKIVGDLNQVWAAGSVRRICISQDTGGQCAF